MFSEHSFNSVTCPMGFPFFKVMWLCCINNWYVHFFTRWCYVVLAKLMSFLSPSSIKYALFLKLLGFPVILVGTNLISFAWIKVVLATQIQALLKGFVFSRKYLTAITSSDGGKIFSWQFLWSLSTFSSIVRNPKIHCLISEVTNTGSYRRS